MNPEDINLDDIQQRLDRAELDLIDLRKDLRSFRCAAASKPQGVVPAEPKGAVASKPPAVPKAAVTPKPPAVPIEVVASKPPDLPPPVPKPQAARSVNLETRIGMVWFNRLGIVALAIGFALLSRLIHPMLAPWHKVALSYLAAGVLIGIGRIFEQRLGNVARPVMAGGLGISFFAGYAAHFVEAMACLPLFASIALMLGSVGGILFCAERWKSQPAAGLAIFLGHLTAYTANSGSVAGSASFSLIAILLLGLCALFLMMRHDWLPLTLFAVAATAVSHLLWAVQTTASLAELDLAFNLQFLLASYAIFTTSDLLYQRRCHQEGRARLPVGRAVGPAALALFSSLALALFWVTQIAWPQLHFFLFPLAGLQLVLYRFQRKWHNPDAAFYLLSGIAFFALGLFAAFQGLGLNLALSTLALVLYLSARMLKLWYLNPVGQGILLIQFGHFWISDTWLVPNWPGYFGALAASAVYLLKARLAETWAPDYEGSESTKPWIAELRRRYAALVQPLSHAYALLGAGFIVYAGYRFLPPLPESAVLLAATGLLLAASLRFKGQRWAWSILLLEAAVILRCAVTASGHPAWSQALAGLVLAALALPCLRSRVATQQPALLLAGAGSLVFACMAAMQATVLPSGSAWWLAAALPALVLVLGQCEWAGPSLRNTPWAARSGTRHWIALFAGGALGLVLIEAFVPAWTGYLLLLPAAGVLLWFAVTWRSQAWTVALLGVFGVLTTLLGFRNPGPEWLHALSFVLVSASAIQLLRKGPETDRPFFSVGGVLALSAAGLGLSMRLMQPSGADWQLIPLWQLGFAGCWGGWEMLRTRYAQLGISPTMAARLAGGASVIAAIGLMMIYAESLPATRVLSRMMLSTGMVLLVVAALRRSWPLAAGYLVCLLATVGMHPGIWVSSHALYLDAVMAFATLFAGACTEIGYRASRGHLDPSGRNGFRIGIWAAYLPGSLLAMASLIREIPGVEFHTAVLLFAIGLYAAGIVLKLRGLKGLGLAWAYFVGSAFLVDMYFYRDESLMFTTGMMLLAGCIGLERLMARFQQEGRGIARRVLISGSAVMMLELFLVAPLIEGGWTTLGWSLSAALFLGLGFAFKERAYRLSGMALFLVAILRIVLFDLAHLELYVRMMAFMGLGACLIAASFLYSRFRDELRKGL